MQNQELTIRRRRSAGNILITIIIAVIFTAGAGLLLYPTVSDLWNRYRNQHLITEYNDSVDTLTNAEITQIKADAQAYNAQHTVNQIVDAFGQEEDYILTHPYDQLLNPNGDEVMGSIIIPKINVNLAIYHGLGKEALENGVGHCEGTSLPIGGEGTHAVLAAHRGLPSAKLFTDLDQLETGDVFYIKVLDETLAYQVDQIKTVLPDETEDLAIVPGQDYVTLITCTPYGVNTHRLLVRGTRIPYTADMASEAQEAQADPYSRYLPYILLAAGVLAVVIISAGIIKRAEKNHLGIMMKRESSHENWENKKKSIGGADIHVDTAVGRYRFGSRR